MQNLALMALALGLGGFLYIAAHHYGWYEELGFRMQTLPASKLLGLGALLSGAARAIGRDFSVPNPIGLVVDGHVLLKPFCPPYYGNMEEAVLAFLEFKYAPLTGTLRDCGRATAWQVVQARVPRYSDRTIAAAIAYCEYIYRHYGRFPAAGGPFRTTLAYQAPHVEPDFYDKFYRAEALTNTQRAHQQIWHAAD